MSEFRSNLYGCGLENISEKIVVEELNKIGDDTKYCKCYICMVDVAAIVLNSIKPCYYTNFIDKSNTSRNAKFLDNLRQEVSKKIAEALEIVYQRPHH